METSEQALRDYTHNVDELFGTQSALLYNLHLAIRCGDAEWSGLIARYITHVARVNSQTDAQRHATSHREGAEMQIATNPTIRIVQGENVGYECSLALFLLDNDLDPETESSLRFDLATTGRFTDGGGAAPIWTIEIVGREIIADYHYAMRQSEALREIDAESSAVYSGLAQAIWAVMTTREKWDSIPEAYKE